MVVRMVVSPIDPVKVAPVVLSPLSAVETHPETPVDMETGLSEKDVSLRLREQGANELPTTARVKPWHLMLSQFNSPIVWALILAGIVSAALGQWTDAIVILAIVVLNAAAGFAQSWRAESGIAALRRMTAPEARVVREGKVRMVRASRVVKGDILDLQAGDGVAADAVLLRCATLSCNESPLTGESESVNKRVAPDAEHLQETEFPEHYVFQGTHITRGSARAQVIAIGTATHLGKIAALVHAGPAIAPPTPLQLRLNAVGRMLVWSALGVVLLLFGLGIWRGMPFLELFMTSVSLAVAAVPEGLPAAVTVALSLGASRMAKRGALVRRLSAVETLGATDVICTDKTGTLTEGAMTTRALYVAGLRMQVSGAGYGPEGDIRIGSSPPQGNESAAMCALGLAQVANNHADRVLTDGVWRALGDPTEAAMLVAAAKAGAERGQLNLTQPVMQEFPFDSERKRSTTVRRKGDGQRAYVTGAPCTILERCVSLWTTEGVRPMTDADRKSILDEAAAMADKALRVLASSWRDLATPLPETESVADIDRLESELTFVGLTGMQDPLRSGSRDAVAQCRDAGIRVIMITGDHIRTASAIAAELSLGDAIEALTGAQLEALSDAALREKVAVVDVYARVTAEHKRRIVDALIANGSVVAMTGDGVNDAPALRGADIGIAMGLAGTAVSREASDMVLTDDNFATIVVAVAEGRGIYDNIRKTLQYLLAGNVSELLAMTCCLVFGLPLMLLPLQLLYLNLATDGLPALCLATDPLDPDVMKRLPRGRTTPLLNRSFLVTLTITSLLTAAVSLSTFVWALQHSTPEEARTMAFSVLVMAELLRSSGARSEREPFWSRRVPLNLPLIAVVLTSLIVQVLMLRIPMLGNWLGLVTLPWLTILALFGIALIPWFVLEVVKLRRVGTRGVSVQRGGVGKPEVKTSGYTGT
jgi:P-type Ca2+ transporter type 2C